MIPGIVLAAGNSSRMGRPKALLPTGPEGELFLERMIRILLDGGVDRRLVAHVELDRAQVHPVLAAEGPGLLGG